MEFRPTGV